VERGKSFEESLPVYQIGEDGMMVNAWRYLDPQGSPIDLIEASDGFYTKTYLQVSAEGEAKPLNLPNDCDVVGYLAGHLLLTLRKDWNRANQSYPSGALVAVKLNRGELGAAQLLFAPDETQALESVETTKRFVVASLLENVQGRLKAWRFSDGKWQEVELPRLPSGALEMTDQPWGGDVLYLAASDFTTPLTLFALDLNVMELTVMRRQPQQFVSDGINVQQFWTTSADGERIPYFHVGKNATPDTPTLVYAYGGFGIPELPHYLGSVGKYWLEEGNAFVLANIRGGGEFGPRWHQAAQGISKHKSVDDLLAVVRDLSEHDRTIFRDGNTVYDWNKKTGTLDVNGLKIENFKNGDLGIRLEEPKKNMSGSGVSIMEMYQKTRENIDRDWNKMSQNRWDFEMERMAVSEGNLSRIEDLPLPAQKLFHSIKERLGEYHEKHGLPTKNEEAMNNAAMSLAALGYSKTMGKGNAELLFNIKDGHYLIGELTPILIKATMDVNSAGSTSIEESIKNIRQTEQKFEYEVLQRQLDQSQFYGMSR